nr:NADP-dependent D-sorbitol-6-phosphate dehydrogenase [Ipomoea batatas]
MCSNYDIFHTRDCLAYSKVKPAVNQIETHPYFHVNHLSNSVKSMESVLQLTRLLEVLWPSLNGLVQYRAWKIQFLKVRFVFVQMELVLMYISLFLLHKGIAEKYKKTVAQIVLCWGIQRNTVVIPKSSKVERLEENFNVFDFELSKEDMELIKSVDRNHRTNQPAKFWGIGLYA